MALTVILVLLSSVVAFLEIHEGKADRGGIALMPGLAVQAQERSSGSTLAFEVVSIRRRSDHVLVGRFGQAPDGSLTLTGVTTANLIGMGYSPFEFDETLGLPEWVRTERYDVIARAPALAALPTAEQRTSMIRALLAERYQMVVHTEVREVPAYDLVLDRHDGQLGRWLIRSDMDCDPPQSLEAIPDDLLPRPRCRVSMEGNRFEGDTTVALFAGFLRNLVRLADRENRMVVDKTGLTGAYHITFESTIQPFTGSLIPGLPSLAAALREQLGLRLENNSSRAVVQVLVIDRLERPSEN